MKGPWNWNPALYAAWPAVFFGYVLDRDLDLTFPWFKGITFKDNNVDIPADAVQTRNLGGYWPPLSSFQSGIPFGPVPPEPVAAQIFFFSPASVAWREFP
jgi:hypothetical protein